MMKTQTPRGEVAFSAPVTAEGVAKLKFGYAGANSVDLTDAIAMEVSGVEDGNVYLTKESAEYLLYSLLNAGVEIPEEFRVAAKAGSR